MLAAMPAATPGVAAADDLVGETQVYSNEAALAPGPEHAVRLMQVAPGLKVELWASEPLLANPVSFALDERGRAFVVETYRHTDGALDNRSRLRWVSDAWKAQATPEQLAAVGEELLDAEIAARTVVDRAAMIRTYMDPAFMTASSDRVTLVEDRDHDGRADHSQVFADGFSTAVEDGIGRGACSRAAATCSSPASPTCGGCATPTATARPTQRKVAEHRLRRPLRLHRPRPARPAHRARRQALLLGRRPRAARRDEAATARSVDPDTGAVLRCDPDGVDLEVFATRPAQPAGAGLRRARQPVHRRQQLRRRRPRPLGPRRRGRRQRLADRLPVLDEPRHARAVERREAVAPERCAGQAGATVIPPVKPISAGPAGLAYYPGTGLPEQ